MKTLKLKSSLNSHWAGLLGKELKKDYIKSLEHFLQARLNNEITLLPKRNEWFNALNSTKLDDIKVVILGQDPYPTLGFAHGLCFSVQPDVNPIPKSLKNIYRELEDDLGVTNTCGNLQAWADQGVLLLNSVLTVESGNANSHKDIGWEQFTNEIISLVNNLNHSVVFVLWGAYAQKKGTIIDDSRHLVIRSPHPSPLSAYRGFYGSKPFSKINDFLRQNGHAAIDWLV